MPREKGVVVQDYTTTDCTGDATVKVVDNVNRCGRDCFDFFVEYSDTCAGNTVQRGFFGASSFGNCQDLDSEQGIYFHATGCYDNDNITYEVFPDNDCTQPFTGDLAAALGQDIADYMDGFTVCLSSPFSFSPSSKRALGR